MSRSLLEALPQIVKEGRRQAEELLENLHDARRSRVRTRERISPWSGHGLHVPPASGIGQPWHNRLIHGDNLRAMAGLLAGDGQASALRGQLDLIYIDPPFDSQADYRTRIALPGDTLQAFAYSDTWAEGSTGYLRALVPRLALMRELLAESGSLYVHLDWHMAHYVKLVLDDLFGKGNFRREIVWDRGTPSGGKAAARNWIHAHDVLLYYTKGVNAFFNKLYEPYPETYLRTRFTHDDRDGRGRYRLQGSGERLRKQYLSASQGKALTSVWRLPDINVMAHERLDYATQKPEALIERVIRASCPEGGLVADFYAGSGTTAAVAERLGRRWIAADQGKAACLLTRKRLTAMRARPFLHQNIDDVPVPDRHGPGDGDPVQAALSLFGAAPLPAAENPARNLGMRMLAGVRTLVWVEPPAALTGLGSLRRALAQHEQLANRCDRLVLLGWRFVPDIGRQVATLGHAHLEVLRIPPDLHNRLQAKGATRRRNPHAHFSSLRQLDIRPVLRRRHGDAEQLWIALAGYALLSPQAVALDGNGRRRLPVLMRDDPLALIDYWSIDPDYDGQCFHSSWQDQRDRRTGRQRVATEACLHVPAREGPRRVCVRVLDVFGVESEAVQIVGPSPSPA